MSKKAGWLVTTLAALMLASHAAAQEEATLPASPDSADIQARLRETIITQLKEKSAALDANEIQMPSMAGREDMRSRESLPAGRCSTSDADPLERIASEAMKTTIVIISEDHGLPQHRYFVGQVLERLRPLGYTAYAAEAFGPTLANGPDVYAADGHYLNEPIFARTVRSAKQLGYRLVPYEMRADQEAPDMAGWSPVEQVEHREQSQTDNLVAAIFADRPAERVIIHVGFSHVYEEPIERRDGGELAWMASRLKGATGIDPLTISQTGCLASGDTTVVSTDVEDSEDGLTSRQPVDLFVGHPTPIFENGRPDWRVAIGDISQPIPGNLVPKDAPVIVEARPTGAPSDSVPIDRIYLSVGERLQLLLPAGRYQLTSFTADGEYGRLEDFQVGAN